MTDVTISRRAFVGCASLGPASLLSTGRDSARAPRARSVIQILMTGGPSQIDTWDPKPAAPCEVRSPFASIATRLPGIHVSELFPRLAARADRVAFLRTVHHDEAPIHETGLQLIQTGEWAGAKAAAPHFGALLSAATGNRRTPIQWHRLTGPLVDTGVPVPRGESSGSLGPEFAPRTGHLVDWETALYQAADLVASAPSVVTINMFPTVFRQVSWDMHASSSRLPTSFADYRRLAPRFDRALAGLLDRLESEGLLDEVIVWAGGEMGRTPRINRHGGRDHWTGAWTMLLAGGGIPGGQAVGVSDPLGAEPADRPIHPREILATIAHHMGVQADSHRLYGKPIRELV